MSVAISTVAIDGWRPASGRVEFLSIALRYRPELPKVIDGLSAVVESGQKAGVVGRTGAGKSSLVLALLRLVEPCEGSIAIDGRDLCLLGLKCVRLAVTCIPQDPTLFAGPLRCVPSPPRRPKPPDWQPPARTGSRQQPGVV